MSITITNEIIVAYSKCPRKAYLLMYSEECGQLHEYEQILEQKQIANRRKHLDILTKNKPDLYNYTVKDVKKDSEFLVNARLIADGLQADCDILTKVNKQRYEPTIFIGTYSINDTDKLRLIFIGHVLAKVQGSPPAKGNIIAIDGKTSLIKLQQGRKTLISLLDPLQQWTANASSPAELPVILNKHCPICRFRTQCEAKAVQEDNLSRLSGVTPRVIRKYEKKGIFTVKQLSYLFKPRKRKKRAKNPPPTIHKIELQALAIRMGKIYLQELPTLTRQETELFLDIESVPDQELHYLLGLLVCQGETITYHAFWVNKADNEETIWQAFWAMVNQYPIAPIYHYGSYESRIITKLAKRYTTNIEHLGRRMINIHRQIYGKVYFPVYSNRLKDVAGFVGATWTHPDASGLQSIVWRCKWEETHKDQYKNVLLTYNEEDCRALKLLVDELFKIQLSANTLPEVDFADKYKEQSTEAGEKVSNQFKEILRFAHFDYDKKKIQFRQDDESKEPKRDKINIKKLASKKSLEKSAAVRRKAKRFIQISPETVCPGCGYEPLTPTKFISRRFLVDLVLTKNGIKKTITEYAGIKGYCRNCKRTFVPSRICKYAAKQTYGHGFGAWVVYQRVALRLPYESIVESAFEQFSEIFAVSQPQQFLKQFAKYYAITEKKITDSLLTSPFIHVDETQANIQGNNWYVWVFTDGKHVIFKLTETRETTIVQEFLANYKGVLITDFYSGYDSVQCKQQRCWVHFIRDLNDDLQENPFDKEYEIFVLKFRDLIVLIMEALRKYGSKKRNLNKFMKEVDEFYQKVITEKQYKSDLVCKYQKRFIRYRDSLFTFLEHDGIPWNNNAAERAIRSFAIQRDMSSPFYASVLRNYLVLLGIRQTCRFQDKSFFKFLFSEETELENFGARAHRH